MLEVSFGTGYLLAECARRFETHGVEYNTRMVRIAERNVRHAGLAAAMTVADVAQLPYRDRTFDSVINTMAFSGYPRGHDALSEMKRVLRPGGRLVLIDVSYPLDGNWLGTRLADLWKLTGDLIRDMGELFRQVGFHYTDEEIGAWGSVHLYVATASETVDEMNE